MMSVVVTVTVSVDQMSRVRDGKLVQEIVAGTRSLLVLDLRIVPLAMDRNLVARQHCCHSGKHWKSVEADCRYQIPKRKR